jgi:glycosyltransferase involved in cell wall biosynthesis
MKRAFKGRSISLPCCKYQILPFFSVIIPVYNRAALLREALDSVLLQTFKDYEVIVVDDGSTDEISAVIVGHSEAVRFFKQANSGPGAARNLGIQNARGDYVAFLDGDDIWFPWTLASYHDVIELSGRPSFVAGNCLKFSKADQLKAVQEENLQHKLFPDYYAAWQESIGIVGCGVVVKTTVIAGTQGFLKGRVNAEDSDMWMKLGTVRDFAYVMSPVLFGYRESPSSVSKIGAKTAAGIRQMVLVEMAGQYPGGMIRRLERWQILTRHVRSISLGCLKEGDWREAWWFYRQSLRWHISLGRLRYLVLMPCLCLRTRLLNAIQKTA